MWIICSILWDLNILNSKKYCLETACFCVSLAFIVTEAIVGSTLTVLCVSHNRHLIEANFWVLLFSGQIGGCISVVLLPSPSVYVPSPQNITRTPWWLRDLSALSQCAHGCWWRTACWLLTMQPSHGIVRSKLFPAFRMSFVDMLKACKWFWP